MVHSVSGALGHRTAARVADALKPAIAELEKLSAIAAEPADEVWDVLRTLDFALRVGDAATTTELAATARKLFESAFVRVGGHKVVGNLLLDLETPGRRSRSNRLETLAKFLGENSHRSGVLMAVWQASVLLPALAPDLPFAPCPPDELLRRIGRDQALNRFSRLCVAAEIPAAAEREIARLLAPPFKMPEPGDGHAIVAAGARLLRLPRRSQQNLFASRRSKAYRARQRQAQRRRAGLAHA